MTKADLKLLKSTKRGAKPVPKLSGAAKYTWHITRAPQLQRDLDDALPDLTPAEHARVLTLGSDGIDKRLRCSPWQQEEP